MRVIIISALLIGAVSAAMDWTSNQPVHNHLKGLAREVNGKQSSWLADEENTFFKGKTASQIKRLMGVKFNEDLKLPTRPAFTAEQLAARPASLDLRDRKFGPHRNTSCIGPILDQGECGSCWAFGAAEAISDRLCMKSGSFLQLAPLDLVTCDQMDGGCDGGDPGSAWQYAVSGLATDKCLPYLTGNGGLIPTCPPAQEPCLNFVDTPNCPTQCLKGGGSIDRSHAVGNVYNVNGIDQMESELDNNGPMEVAFTVYSDFLTYKSGVYYYQSGDELGGHAVKVIGYGTESGMDYWLCQNSWTTSWGDNGMFKIRKGTDECGIEDDVVAGTIASTNAHKLRKLRQ